MDQLLYYDALATLYLQKWLYSFPCVETVAATVTKLGDPRYSYAVTFPVVYWFLGATAGHHVLLTACLAEWCNIILKWLLLGNRPYWWVGLHTDWPHLLHQTSVTCETGPGNPSGHVMITLAVLLTCADHVESGSSLERERDWSLRSIFCRLVWLIVALIAVSRLLISAHFVHQIVIGVVVGLVLHAASGPCLRPLLSQWRWLMGAAPVMIALGLVLFQVWTWLGMDPGFSIPLAERYCANREWVRLDTTPFFSITRAAGAAEGVAIVTALRPVPSRFHGSIAIAAVLASLALIGCLDMVPMATDITAFYLQSFCLWAAVPLTVGGVDLVLRWIIST